MKLYLIGTLMINTLVAYSWQLNKELFKEVSQLFAVLLHTQAKLFTSTQMVMDKTLTPRKKEKEKLV